MNHTRSLLGMLALLLTACNEPAEFPLAPYECPAHVMLPQLIGIEQETGYMKAPDGDLFYWWVQAQNSPAQAPLVVWLQGGPGSSSLLGLFLENGPYRLNKDLSLYENPSSWHENAHLLYIDQPAGTGFSWATSNLVVNQQQVAHNIVAGLQDFLKQHPSLQDKDVYIAGESFAGTYIPYLSHAILESQQSSEIPIHLKGLIIGDGTVDQSSSLSTLPEFAFTQGLIDEAQREAMEANLVPACQKQIKEQVANGTLQTPAICRQIQASLPLHMNTYDTRRFGDYDFRPLSCYLNHSDVQSFLKVQKEWNQNNAEVLNRLYGQGLISTVPFLQEALSKDIKVLIYTGDKDFLINPIGTQKWTFALAKEQGIQMSPSRFFLEEDQLIGERQESPLLWYFVIYDAGHLVPMDAPAAAKKMLDEFLGFSS